ncbi:MAG: hypothetical protein II187_12140 [Treponema sp.]|nr:hypothetical protein [Treponema sp.]
MQGRTLLALLLQVKSDHIEYPASLAGTHGGRHIRDPFEAGLPVYTFERKCREPAAVEPGDATHHVIFNAAACGQETNPEIKVFLAFVKNNRAESDLTREIAAMMQTKKCGLAFSWRAGKKSGKR